MRPWELRTKSHNADTEVKVERQGAAQLLPPCTQQTLWRLSEHWRPQEGESENKLAQTTVAEQVTAVSQQWAHRGSAVGNTLGLYVSSLPTAPFYVNLNF